MAEYCNALANPECARRRHADHLCHLGDLTPVGLTIGECKLCLGPRVPHGWHFTHSACMDFSTSAQFHKRNYVADALGTSCWRSQVILCSQLQSAPKALHRSHDTVLVKAQLTQLQERECMLGQALMIVGGQGWLPWCRGSCHIASAPGQRRGAFARW